MQPANNKTNPARNGTDSAKSDHCISALAKITPRVNATTPNADQTAKYAAPQIAVFAPRLFSFAARRQRRKRKSIGTSDGSIMASIMTVHIARNNEVAPAQVCPGIFMQVIDRGQPPGISIPPDMDKHQ